MTDCPIIFSAQMVRALLEGRKTQTRRVLDLQPYELMGQWWITDRVSGDCQLDDWVHHRIGVGPRWQAGDRLWVREVVRFCSQMDGIGPAKLSPHEPRLYAADGYLHEPACMMIMAGRPRPAIHMPRWASRLTLTVTDVRVQRLQGISEMEAAAEGATAMSAENGPDEVDGVSSFVWGLHTLWNSIHGPGAWVPFPEDLPRGGIVGTAEIVDCVESSESPWFAGRYGFVLHNVQPVEVIPVKGALGFFEWRKQT